MAVQIIGLRKLEELPEVYESDKITDATHAVMVTYRRVVGTFKNSNSGRMEPSYGGSMAIYPRELGFKLDRSRLLPNLL